MLSNYSASLKQLGQIFIGCFQDAINPLMEILTTALVLTEQHVITCTNTQVFLQGDACRIVFFLHHILQKLELFCGLALQLLGIGLLLHQEDLIRM